MHIVGLFLCSILSTHIRILFYIGMVELSRLGEVVLAKLLENIQLIYQPSSSSGTSKRQPRHIWQGLGGQRRRRHFVDLKACPVCTECTVCTVCTQTLVPSIRGGLIYIYIYIYIYVYTYIYIYIPQVYQYVSKVHMYIYIQRYKITKHR